MKQIFALLFILLIASSCGSGVKREKSSDELTTQITVAVTNYPLFFFTQQIAGDKFEVLFPVPGDIDPAFFEPGAEVVSTYQSAEIIFINGAGYESWVDKVSLPQRRIVNTTAMVSDQYIQEKGMSHSHGPDGEHDPAETAFTTWLDQSIALEQAKLIYETLKNSYPESSQIFDSDFKKLETELMSLDKQMEEAFSSWANASVSASHPVYQYLGARYGLHIHSEHWEPEQNVDPDVVKIFIESLHHNDSQLMLWEGDPHPETRKLLEEANIKIVVFLPCGNKPEQGDYLTVMKQNLKKLDLGDS
ncbi:MAG TPA: zinc ABC transporter substrate-binding protein [Bacteroides sp.]|nr:zinc ABC transporter substrate-binding protein [Bacteroides sp.]